jgi:hypothetical protein
MRWPLPWPSVPEFLFNNPWAVGLIEWLGVLKSFWDQYNSLLVLVGLWLVARKLKGERERLEERVDTLGQHVKAAVEVSDSAIVAAKEASAAAKEASVEILGAIAASTGSRAPLANGAHAVPNATKQQQETGDNNWKRVSEIWGELKDRIELKIQNISQKRVRAKYSRMPRRTYEDVITALRKDEVLKRGVALKLLQLDHEYKVLRFKPKDDVTAVQVAMFVEVQRIVNATRALPLLPNDEAEEVGVGPAETPEQPEPPPDTPVAVAIDTTPAASRAAS